MTIELPNEPNLDDLSALHRWFAVRLNNQVWDILDAESVTASSPESEQAQVMYAAQAAAHHWYQVGSAVNHARAEYLVARTSVVTGNPHEALRHADRAIKLCQANPDLVSDWDVAMAHEVLARAQAANGLTNEAAATLDTARALADAVVDPQDRAVVEGELARQPWFGLSP